MSILSWATFDDDGGVALSNLGVSGTQLRDLAERDDSVMAAEFDAYRPDLIILAFGTDEGYVPHADVAAYETLLREQIARLRRLSWNTDLVLGAPDAETLRPDLYGSGGVFPDCTPLSDQEVQDYPALVQAKSPLLAHWYPPAGLAEIRAAQQRAADDEHAAFWNWEARMGGPCSAHRMGLEEPKLVRGDHIHYARGRGEDRRTALWRPDRRRSHLGGGSIGDALPNHDLRAVLPGHLCVDLEPEPRERAAEAVPVAGQLGLLRLVGLAFRPGF